MLNLLISVVALLNNYYLVGVRDLKSNCLGFKIEISLRVQLFLFFAEVITDEERFKS